MSGFSLAVRPWIAVEDGRASLAGVLRRAAGVQLAEASPLARAAVLRLCAMAVYASGAAPDGEDAYVRAVGDPAGVDWARAADWVERHAEEFDLYHPERPFLQDGALHQVAAQHPEAVMNPLYVDLTAAWGRGLLSDGRHWHTPTVWDPGEAARLLLVHQMWAPGGRLAASEVHFGPGANYGSVPPHTGAMVWMPRGASLAEELAWRCVPDPDPGAPVLSYEVRSPVEAGVREVEPGGMCDGLVWMPRRVLYRPDGDGDVAGLLLCQGWRRRVPGVPCLGPGLEDIALHESTTATTAEAWPLSAGYACETPDDAVRPVESWWAGGAVQGSLPWWMQRAAAATGRVPGVAAVGLAAQQKKINAAVEVVVPPAAAGDPSAAGAAGLLRHYRRRRRGPRMAVPAPLGAGADLLHDAGFVAADEAEQGEAAAAAMAPPARVAAPVEEPDSDSGGVELSGRAAELSADASLFTAPSDPEVAPEREDGALLARRLLAWYGQRRLRARLVGVAEGGGESGRDVARLVGDAGDAAAAGVVVRLFAGWVACAPGPVVLRRGGGGASGLVRAVARGVARPDLVAAGLRGAGGVFEVEEVLTPVVRDLGSGGVAVWWAGVYEDLAVSGGEVGRRWGEGLVRRL